MADDRRWDVGRAPCAAFAVRDSSDRRRRGFTEEARRAPCRRDGLPGSLGQPLPPRPEQQPLQGQVLFLEAGVGALKLLGRRAGLVELTLQVVESLEQGGVCSRTAELRLAGRQVVGDGVSAPS